MLAQALQLSGLEMAALGAAAVAVAGAIGGGVVGLLRRGGRGRIEDEVRPQIQTALVDVVRRLEELKSTLGTESRELRGLVSQLGADVRGVRELQISSAKDVEHALELVARVEGKLNSLERRMDAHERAALNRPPPEIERPVTPRRGPAGT